MENLLPLTLVTRLNGGTGKTTMTFIIALFNTIEKGMRHARHPCRTCHSQFGSDKGLCIIEVLPFFLPSSISVRSLSSLRPEDQQKIRTAIHRGRVDSADIPPSARPPVSTHVSPAIQSAPSQKERRALLDAAAAPATYTHSSAASTTAPIVPAHLPPAVELTPVVVPSSQGPPSQKQRRALRDAVAAASSTPPIATPSTSTMPASSSQVSSPRGISSQGQRFVAIAATKASPKKRKLPHDSLATSAAVPPSSQALAPVEDETLEEETREELYTSMRTNVVGIQYYKGWFPRLIGSCPFHAFLRFGRSRRRGYSESRAT